MIDYTFDTVVQQIEQWIRLDYINPEDIPAIELYMDQITTFMDKQLAGNKRQPDDKILTKTMINNYSKNHLLPPSDKKKYSKDHIILLIYIYYMKNFLSITDIQNILTPLTDSYFHAESGITMSDIYEDLFHLEMDYGIHIKENIRDVCRIAKEQFQDTDEYLKIFALIIMLSHDIYMKKQLIEHLIDSITPPAPTKAERKEAKENAKKEKQEKNAS